MMYHCNPIFALPPIPPPTLGESIAALTPTPWLLDIDFWQEHYQPESDSKDPLCAFIDQHIRDGGTTLTYTHIANPKRSPRRYPLVDYNQSYDKFLLSQNDVKSDTPTLYLSNLPKKLRPVLKPQQGHQLLDWDITAAHPTIVAVKSGDVNMLEWVQNDPHTDTGNHFGAAISDPVVRRKFGKGLNSSIMMGISTIGLRDAFREHEELPELNKEEAEDLLKTWWEKFPVARAFRIEHGRYILWLRDNGYGYQIKYGRNLATYDNRHLQGTCWHQDKRKSQRSESDVLRSTWSAYVTSFEAAAMEHILVLAHERGLKLGLPMYDGAMWHVPNGFDLAGFVADAHRVLGQWSMLGRSKVEI